MKTRKQYMNNEVTHAEYYGQFGKLLVGMVGSTIGVDRIKASTDPHFNDIQMREWDALSPRIMYGDVGRMIAKANYSGKGTGGISLSDCVCAAKSAAKIIRDGERVIIIEPIYNQMLELQKTVPFEIDNHESDLYVPVNPDTTRLIDNYHFKCNVERFNSAIDGSPWYDIPFAYLPAWNRKGGLT